MAQTLPPTNSTSGDETNSSQQQLQHLQQQLGVAGDQLNQLQQMSQQQPGALATEETKGNEGLDDDDGDALSKWLAHFGLTKSAAALEEAGLDEYGLIKSLEDDDMKEMIKEAKLKKLKEKAFRRGVKAVKDEEYPPKQAVPVVAQGVDPTLIRLKESRKDWKGIVHRKRDGMNANDGKQTRTVIFIGQTGAGKTTLINSMANYLHRVGYHEQFRYNLIMEEKDAEVDTKDTTKSQTQSITKYHLRDLPAIGFALNVIDTPGFGDTEGPEQDKKIRGKFRDFFNQEDRIDAIYFVIKSSDTRLGAIQKYIFNMVLDLFGNDVKDNIFILFTFSDGAKPPALEAVKKLKVPYKDTYQINNSGFGFFDPEEMQALTHEMFFDLGMKQFEVIFQALNKVTPVSTNLTRETLKERDTITARLYDIGQQLKTALEEINAMHRTKKFIEANKDKMDANEDFKIEDFRIDTHKDPVPNGCNTTHCLICVSTCHSSCVFSDNADKRHCGAMDSDGHCRVCQRKCPWNQHRNMPYTIRRERVTVWRTKKEMAEKFEMAKGQKATAENLMRASIRKIDELEQEIIRTIKGMKKSVNRLKEIALNTEVLTDDQYFDTLIQTERDEAKPEWEDRVRQLENMKKQNGLLRDVTEKDENDFLKKEFRSNQYLQTYRQQYNTPGPTQAKKKKSQSNSNQRTVTNETQILGFTVYKKTTTVKDSEK
eukprot:CAMPEP_0197037882 /NCGR_PEP_ID=MMETSP1384-20130603/14977_1 /TAXON_ID=29189 /ORGANISM="Ammonia sp." /LENGTH=709 /DNA_ID=CAMNT_0042468259 /DNA_START=111 /DNA_END=2240 /DNA_ORIENTATION=-